MKSKNFKTSKKKKKSSFKRVILASLILLFVIATCAAIDICVYAEKDETKKADAAIVLGAAIWGDKPSPVFEERIKHGIWLYKNGYVDKLIFTGGKSKGKEYSEAEVAKNYALEASVASEDIYIEERSTITQENMQNAAEIMEEKNLFTVLIVSDPLHMRRAMLMAKDYKLTAYSSPTPTSRYKSLGSKAGFLAREVFFYIGYLVYRIF